MFRRRRGTAEFLALRRAVGRALPGVWQPVTGKLKRGETAFAAARREVREETGLSPFRWWSLETPTLYFDPGRDLVVALPLFAAEVQANASVKLADEHQDARFFTARSAGELYLWHAQRRGLEAVAAQVLAGGTLAQALAIALPRAERRRRTPKAHRSDPRR